MVKIMIMTKVGDMQHRCRSLQQKQRLSGITQNRFLSLAIRIFICYTVFPYIFTSVSSDETSCFNKEMKSLLAFKSGLQDRTGLLDSWNVSLSCCQWERVSCDRRTGHVVAVDLHNCNLGGKFRPAALFDLTALEHLDISFNNFTGLPIPSEMGLLINLKYLSLSTAGFAGTIPWQLRNLSNLTGLDLSSSPSMLTSPDLSWLSSLTALVNLSLNGVDLSAASSSWGQSISHLSQLRNLTMTNCGLTGSIPPSLQKLTSLRILHLDRNTFHSEIPNWLGNMTSLVSLQMTSANLNGSLPFELLSRLAHLKNIYLGNNKISANVSLVFQGQWKSLTIFQMPNNSLYGSLPYSIGNLSSLALLELDLNKLKGTIPESLGFLRSLTVLDLGYNLLTGAIPLSLGLLSKLTNISLSHSALSGAISESHFGSLNNLKYLDLSNNKLTFNITSMWNPPFHLEVLILSVCKIEWMFLAFLKTQHSIKTVDLSKNSLRGQIPIWMWNLPKLEKLLLSHNQLEGPIPPQLYNSSSLREVELRDNQLHGDLDNPAGSSVAGFPWKLDLSINNIASPVPQEICLMLRTSNFLSLASNKLEGQIPPCICDQTEYLEVLDLSRNKLNGQFPSNLSNCSSLKVLNVANNNLEGQIPVELGKLKKLQVLHINDNRLNGHVPSSLRNCKMLEILDLSGNNLSGNVPEWIADLSKLRILILRSNNLEGEIPIQIRYLQNLQILDMAMNRLSGSILRQLSNISTLTNEDFTSSLSGVLRYGTYYKEEVYLMIKGHLMEYEYILSLVTSMDFSANSLTGNIPGDIGDLAGLSNLNLSRNRLTGNIPEELGKMVNLESLDMSWNQLEGRIPAALANLTFLGYLNLSYNKLSGTIPNGPHLDTFGATSFLGNPQLCGLPLARNCSEHTRKEGPDSFQQTHVHWWESWDVGMGMGIAIGFGGVIGALTASRVLRTRYFQIADSFMNSFQ